MKIFKKYINLQKFLNRRGGATYGPTNLEASDAATYIRKEIFGLNAGGDIGTVTATYYYRFHEFDLSV